MISKHPSEWSHSLDDKLFKRQRLVKRMAVVNDRAERGVALIRDFKKKLTKDEGHLQFLLQVVSETINNRLRTEPKQNSILSIVTSTSSLSIDFGPPPTTALT